MKSSTINRLIFAFVIIFFSSCKTTEKVCPDIQCPEKVIEKYKVVKVKDNTDSIVVVDILKEIKNLTNEINEANEELNECKKKKEKNKIIYKKSTITNNTSTQTSNLQNIIDSLTTLNLNVAQTSTQCPPCPEVAKPFNFLFLFIISLILNIILIYLLIRK